MSPYLLLLALTERKCQVICSKFTFNYNKTLNSFRPFSSVPDPFRLLSYLQIISAVLKQTNQSQIFCIYIILLCSFPSQFSPGKKIFSLYWMTSSPLDSQLPFHLAYIPTSPLNLLLVRSRFLSLVPDAADTSKYLLHRTYLCHLINSSFFLCHS